MPCLGKAGENWVANWSTSNSGLAVWLPISRRTTAAVSGLRLHFAVKPQGPGEVCLRFAVLQLLEEMQTILASRKPGPPLTFASYPAAVGKTIVYHAPATSLLLDAGLQP